MSPGVGSNFFVDRLMRPLSLSWLSIITCTKSRIALHFKQISPTIWILLKLWEGRKLGFVRKSKITLDTTQESPFFTLSLSPGARTDSTVVRRSWLIWLICKSPLTPPMSIKAPYGFTVCTVPSTTDPIPNTDWLSASAFLLLKTKRVCSSSTSKNLSGSSLSTSSSGSCLCNFFKIPVNCKLNN